MKHLIQKLFSISIQGVNQYTVRPLINVNFGNTQKSTILRGYH